VRLPVDTSLQKGPSFVQLPQLIYPRSRLKPAGLCGLLNNSPLGVRYPPDLTNSLHLERVDTTYAQLGEKGGRMGRLAYFPAKNPARLPAHFVCAQTRTQ
jgi:hypothetical protein